MRTLAIVLLAVTVTLSGCTILNGNSPTPKTTTTPATSTTEPTVTTTGTPTTSTTPSTTPTPTGVPADAYTLAISDVPTSVEVGTKFNFTLNATGSTSRNSDHIGAHYGANSSTTPSTTVYGNACDHQTGALPGLYNVTCTISTLGIAHLRGHARLAENGITTDYWSAEANITVRGPVGNYTLTSPNATVGPTGNAVLPPATAGKAYTFTLNITGDATDTSDHIGAHYGYNTSTAVPTTKIYDHSCAHQAGSLPGEFTVTCTFASGDVGQSVYVRGHMRITVGSVKHDYWTTEYGITVLPASPI